MMQSDYFPETNTLAYLFWCHIFSCVRPSYEQAVSDLDRSMHISLWVWVARSSFIEGSHTTKDMASGHDDKAEKVLLWV